LEHYSELLDHAHRLAEKLAAAYPDVLELRTRPDGSPFLLVRPAPKSPLWIGRYAASRSKRFGVSVILDPLMGHDAVAGAAGMGGGFTASPKYVARSHGVDRPSMMLGLDYALARGLGELRWDPRVGPLLRHEDDHARVARNDGSFESSDGESDLPFSPPEIGVYSLGRGLSERLSYSRDAVDEALIASSEVLKPKPEKETIIDAMMISFGALKQARALAESDLAIYSALDEALAKGNEPLQPEIVPRDPRVAPTLGADFTAQITGVKIREGRKTKRVNFFIPLSGKQMPKDPAQVARRVHHAVGEQVARLKAVTPVLVEAHEASDRLFAAVRNPKIANHPERKALTSAMFGLLARALRESGAVDTSSSHSVDITPIRNFSEIFASPVEVKMKKISDNGSEQIWEISGGGHTARASYRPDFLLPWKLLP
jgi:hypothetical protein